ncbi:MAG: response regulator [Clostridia bacterium]|nr:response regulator [Clostridia bacterium]
MVNVLVIEDNFYYSKSLINILADTNPKMRLCKISTNGKEAIEILKNQENAIDIILLDLKLPHYNGIEILNYIKSNNLIKYKNSIIVISGEVELLTQIRNNPYLYSYINKMSGLDNALNEINKLIEIKEEEKSSIEYRVVEELRKLHYNFLYIGTKYLEESILLMYNKDNWENIKLEKDIYPILSKKHKKTVNNIKTNIINATDLMYYDCESKILNEYFKICENEKPTPKIVISTVIDKLKYNL